MRGMACKHGHDKLEKQIPKGSVEPVPKLNRKLLICACSGGHKASQSNQQRWDVPGVVFLEIRRISDHCCQQGAIVH